MRRHGLNPIPIVEKKRPQNYTRTKEKYTGMQIIDASDGIKLFRDSTRMYEIFTLTNSVSHHLGPLPVDKRKKKNLLNNSNNEKRKLNYTNFNIHKSMINPYTAIRPF